ncbi:MAG: hypothetical protein NTX57_04840 [Armatimonadetes bacterium]|nr:hypothetical protein [Armatimonadota bacterium]
MLRKQNHVPTPLTPQEKRQLQWSYWFGTILTAVLCLLLFSGFSFLKGAFPDALPKWLWSLLKAIFSSGPLWVLLAHAQGHRRVKETGLSREATLQESWSRKPRSHHVREPVAVLRQLGNPARFAIGFGGLFFVGLGTIALLFVFNRHWLSFVLTVPVIFMGLGCLYYAVFQQRNKLLALLQSDGIAFSADEVLPWKEICHVDVTRQFDYLGRETELTLAFTDTNGKLSTYSMTTYQQQEPTTSEQLQKFYEALQAAFEHRENIT